MGRYTDVAAELYGERRGSVPQGVKVHTARAAGVRLTRVEITRAGLRRAPGTYITLDMPPLAGIDAQDEAFVHAVASQLRALLPARGPVLVAGIGSAAVAADALGPATARLVFATPARAQADGVALRAVAAFAPGTESDTGLATLQTLRGLAAACSPAAVLCVDSLCTASPWRLGRSVQLSDAGLFPRGGTALCRAALGVPVVAAGVPTLMEVRCAHAAPMLMAPKDVDAVVRRGARLLALAVNKALQPALRVDELAFLTS